jgi:hypothetical protein
VTVEENVGDYPSPTILVDGVDVMGSTEFSGQACRVDVPMEERLMAALRKMKGQPDRSSFGPGANQFAAVARLKGRR